MALVQHTNHQEPRNVLDANKAFSISILNDLSGIWIMDSTVLCGSSGDRKQIHWRHILMQKATQVGWALLTLSTQSGYITTLKN